MQGYSDYAGKMIDEEEEKMLLEANKAMWERNRLMFRCTCDAPEEELCFCDKPVHTGMKSVSNSVVPQAVVAESRKRGRDADKKTQKPRGRPRRITDDVIGPIMDAARRAMGEHITEEEQQRMEAEILLRAEEGELLDENLLTLERLSEGVRHPITGEVLRVPGKDAPLPCLMQTFSAAKKIALEQKNKSKLYWNRSRTKALRNTQIKKSGGETSCVESGVETARARERTRSHCWSDLWNCVYGTADEGVRMAITDPERPSYPDGHIEAMAGYMLAAYRMAEESLMVAATYRTALEHLYVGNDHTHPPYPYSAGCAEIGGSYRVPGWQANGNRKVFIGPTHRVAVDAVRTYTKVEMNELEEMDPEEEFQVIRDDDQKPYFDPIEVASQYVDDFGYDVDEVDMIDIDM